MKLVIFGLTISSSWGNGHATLWRGLCKGLARRGHQVVFYERDVPYYAAQRDLFELPSGRLILYPDWESVLPQARADLIDADVGMVTSYCPDGPEAADLVLHSRARLRVFYDLDTPITLQRVQSGIIPEYIGPRGLEGFDLVLNYTGGEALEQLRSQLKAKRVAPLYGSVDPQTHRPVPPIEAYRADLSYLGTYAQDRQTALERFFIAPARQRPDLRFLIGGAQYPEEFPWKPNIYFVRHLPPAEHPAFFSSSRLTLNVTRQVMAELGYCPSGRLFEVAACGVPIISDSWAGLDGFFEPAREILVVSKTRDVLDALSLSDKELAAIGHAGRQRALEEHSADRRALELERLLETLSTPPEEPTTATVSG